MASRILPRYLLLVSLLAVAVVAVMLSMFYGQYQWLATGIVETGVVEHELSIADSFENQSLSVLEKTVDGLAENGLATSNARLRLYLNRVVAETEKAILKSDLGLTPSSDAGLPQLEQEAPVEKTIMRLTRKPAPK